jgi:hypothetical protein
MCTVFALIFCKRNFEACVKKSMLHSDSLTGLNFIHMEVSSNLKKLSELLYALTFLCLHIVSKVNNGVSG